MLEKTRLFFSKNKFKISIPLWIFLYFTFWVTWLEQFPWVRLGIGILIFSTPGTVLSLFLANKRLNLPGHFISGLALSVFFVGSLGLIGRIFHLPFEFIKPVFFLTGLIALLILGKYFPSDHQWYKPKSFSIMTLIVLSLMIAFGVTVSFLGQFQGDDFSYLAYLTNWQHAQLLNFREVIFNTGGVDSIRFWFAMFPMDLAFLSEISSLPGVLLIGVYLEPFLIVIAILAAYTLYEDLLQSEYLAISALLLQFTFLVLRSEAIPMGRIFFNPLFHDKAFAGFILLPVFFLAIRYFVDSFNLSSGAFVFFTGLSVTLTHPVITAFGIFIAGVYAAIVMINKRDFKKIGIIAVLLVTIILPVASTRIIQLPWITQHIPALASVKEKGVFDLESALNTKNIDPRISYIKGTPFYGFNLNTIKIRSSFTKDENLIQYLFSWSYLWALVLGFLWSLFNLRKNALAPFIAATSFLVLLAAIPYTGWLVGYFVSARLLLRASWMLPVGLIGTVLLVESFKYAANKIPKYTQTKIHLERVVFGLILTISLVSIGYFYTVYVSLGGWRSLTTFDQYRSNLEKFADFGDYLENNIPTASIFIAPTPLSNYLPGLSSKSKVVFFRAPQFLPYPVNVKQINRLFSRDISISLAERMSTLTKYHVDYILTKDRSLKDYYAGYSKNFHIQENNNFWLVKIQKNRH